MEQERDLLHLLVEHQFILFGIGAVIILGLLVAVAFFLGKRAQRKDERREK